MENWPIMDRGVAWRWLDECKFKDNDLTYYIDRALNAACIHNSLTIYSVASDINLIRTHEEIIQDLEKFSIYPLQEDVRVSGRTPRIFIGDLTYIYISGSNELSITSSSQKKVEDLLRYFRSISISAERLSNFYVISRRGQGYDLNRLNITLKPFEEMNYTKQTAIAFKKIIKEINSEDPLGRITIINGEPGTGKTFLLRHLAYELPDTAFVILPGELVPYLVGPDGITIMQSVCSNSNDPNSSGATVLVIEDADQILQRRMMDNISSISTLLNLCAGIIGDAFDIRIIATTNAKSLEIEPALQRPGRLSQRITIEKLLYEQAKECAESLGYKGILKEQSYTLADIYRLQKLQKIEEEELRSE